MIAKIYPDNHPELQGKKDPKHPVRYFDIRKLTPPECYRLMGVPERQISQLMATEQKPYTAFVDVVGTSKGKGFQGVVKRHGFGGVGQSTHGQDDRLRKPGSIGACSYPAKVFKGMRMGGQMGGDRVTTQNLRVLKVIPESNLLIVKGSVAGFNGSTVIINK